MRVLLDTSVLLWLLTDSPKLSAEHRAVIADPSCVLYVSSVSVAEIAIKVSVGKLPPPSGSVPEVIVESGLMPLPLTSSHADALSLLPMIHRDPFDRMLLAQAMVEDLVFLTTNEQNRRYTCVRTL